MYRLNEIPSYEALLKYHLDRIPGTYDKREGSVIFNAVAPVCFELSNLYLKLKTYTDLIFIDTTVGSYLDRLVLQNGVTRNLANAAVRLAQFDTEIPIGTMFIKDNVQFTATRLVMFVDKPDGTRLWQYQLTANDAGIIGNVTNGTLTAMNRISGLGLAEIIGTVRSGNDDETDEALRQRYIDNVTDIPYGGNQADYRQTVSKMDGVGEVKVIPVWNGPGTVKVIITGVDANGYPTVPTNDEIDNYLVNRIQENLDPIPQQMGGSQYPGIGIAPIGHLVTVVPVENRTIDIVANVTLNNPPSDLQMNAEQTIKDYLNSVNTNWDLIDVVIRVSQISNRLLDLDGIIDIGDVTVNGELVNLTLSDTEIATFGSLTLVNA